MDRTELRIKIVYEDSHLVIVDKPVGLATVPLKGGIESLAEMVARTIPSLHHLPDGGACHRLDNDTSGLVVFAKNRTAYIKMREAFSKDQVGREYAALVEGELRESIRIDWPIGPDPKSSKKVRVYKTLAAARRHRALPATTWIRPIQMIHPIRPDQTIGVATPAQVTIRGGRRHQIRAHLEAIGHTVLRLHASRLSFAHPSSGRRIDVEAPPPRGFEGAETRQNK